MDVPVGSSYGGGWENDQGQPGTGGAHPLLGTGSLRPGLPIEEPLDEVGPALAQGGIVPAATTGLLGGIPELGSQWSPPSWFTPPPVNFNVPDSGPSTLWNRAPPGQVQYFPVFGGPALITGVPPAPSGTTEVTVNPAFDAALHRAQVAAAAEAMSIEEAIEMLNEIGAEMAANPNVNYSRPRLPPALQQPGVAQPPMPGNTGIWHHGKMVEGPISPDAANLPESNPWHNPGRQQPAYPGQPARIRPRVSVPTPPSMQELPAPGEPWTGPGPPTNWPARLGPMPKVPFGLVPVNYNMPPPNVPGHWSYGNWPFANAVQFVLNELGQPTWAPEWRPSQNYVPPPPSPVETTPLIPQVHGAMRTQADFAAFLGMMPNPGYTYSRNTDGSLSIVPIPAPRPVPVETMPGQSQQYYQPPTPRWLPGALNDFAPRDPGIIGMVASTAQEFSPTLLALPGTGPVAVNT